MDQVTATPPVRQFPISYIRAFAYHPVAFPQPLAPITTYHVSRNQQSFNANRNFPASNSVSGAMMQALQQQLIQSQDQIQGGFPQPPTNQQLPQNAQVEFGTQPSTTSTTTTTTPAPVTTTAQPAQPVLTRSGFSEGYQRQIPIQHQSYTAGNFGGFPQFYNQPYSQPYNQYSSMNQYNEGANQFSGRLFGAEPTYQQYSADPLTYQFIPTSITPISNQNNIKFVPCMCPVAVQISPPLAEKRTDEIPILSSPTETENVPPPTQQMSEESK